MGGSVLSMTDCSITQNYGSFGGGIFVSVSTVTIRNCNIIDNSCNVYGGGMYLNHSTVTISNTNVLRNVAVSSDGGGIAILNSTVTMTNSTVSSNSIYYEGRQGGGVYLNQGMLTMTNCVVSGNANDGFGGGIYVGFGSTATLTSCEITKNDQGLVGKTFGGGGIYVYRSKVTMTNCDVSSNTATTFGGGLYCDGGAKIISVGSAFNQNRVSGVPNDVYVGSSGASLEFLSDCPQDEFNAGEGLLLCIGCSQVYPADLSSGQCSACPETSYSCCGSLECSSSVPECSIDQNTACPPLFALST